MYARRQLQAHVRRPRGLESWSRGRASEVKCRHRRLKRREISIKVRGDVPQREEVQGGPVSRHAHIRYPFGAVSGPDSLTKARPLAATNRRTVADELEDMTATAVPVPPQQVLDARVPSAR